MRDGSERGVASAGHASSAAPRAKRCWLDTLLLALGAALLYATTWIGEYFHDSVLFIERLERGELLWVHVAYLLLGRLLELALAPLGVSGAERVLSVLSVLVGAAVVAAVHRLALAWTGSRWAACAAALALGFAPAVWYGAGHVELHLFSGLGALLAALWVLAGPGPLALRVAGGTVLALSTHLTAFLVAPFFVVLGLAGEQRRGRKAGARAVLVGTAAVALALLSMKVATVRLPPGSTSESDFVSGVIELTRRRLATPRVFAAKLGVDVLLPWLLVLAGPLLAPFVARPAGGRRIVALAALPLALAVLWATALTPARTYGQYSLILLPVFACALAEVLARAEASGPGARRVAALALLLVHVLPGVIVHRRLAQDPDREWAEAVAEHAEPTATVYCFGQLREHCLRGLTEAHVENFAPVGDRIVGDARPFVLDCAQNHLAAGRALYFDPMIFQDGPQIPILVPILRALDECVVLAPVEGVELFVLTGLREPAAPALPTETSAKSQE